jgi:hypothetical protein
MKESKSLLLTVAFIYAAIASVPIESGDETISERWGRDGGSDRVDRRGWGDSRFSTGDQFYTDSL